MRRTAKKFIDYNEYRDRPFGLKWGTAFAMEELVNGIKKNEEEARKQPLPKQQMTLQEIDSIPYVFPQYRLMVNHKVIFIGFTNEVPFDLIQESSKFIFLIELNDY